MYASERETSYHVHINRAPQRLSCKEISGRSSWLPRGARTAEVTKAGHQSWRKTAEETALQSHPRVLGTRRAGRQTLIWGNKHFQRGIIDLPLRIVTQTDCCPNHG